MATLADIVTLTKAHIGGRENIDSLVESRINRATLDVIGAHMPHESREVGTITTAEGTAAYDLAADCYAIRAVRNDDTERVIEPGTLRKYAESGWTEYGTPRHWIREKNQIILFNPLPNDNDGDNFTIRYWYLERPAYMDDTADTFPLNYEWEDPVSILASAKVLSMINEPERAQAKMQEYDAETAGILLPGQVEAKIPERRVEFDYGYRYGTGVRY